MYEELRGLSGLRARGVGRVYGSRVGFRVVGFRVLGLASTVFLFWMWVFYRCVFLVVSALLAAGTSFLAAGCARAGAFLLLWIQGAFLSGVVCCGNGAARKEAPLRLQHIYGFPLD